MPVPPCSHVTETPLGGRPGGLREWVFSLGSLIGILGIGCFNTLGEPHDMVKLLLYACAGLGLGMRISLLAAIPADLFHGKHFGAIVGFVNGGDGPASPLAALPPLEVCGTC